VISLAINTDIDQQTQQDDDTRIFSIDSMQTGWKRIYSHTFPWALHVAIFPYEMTFSFSLFSCGHFVFQNSFRFHQYTPILCCRVL